MDDSRLPEYERTLAQLAGELVATRAIASLALGLVVASGSDPVRILLRIQNILAEHREDGENPLQNRLHEEFEYGFDRSVRFLMNMAQQFSELSAEK